MQRGERGPWQRSMRCCGEQRWCAWGTVRRSRVPPTEPGITCGSGGTAAASRRWDRRHNRTRVTRDPCAFDRDRSQQSKAQARWVGSAVLWRRRGASRQREQRGSRHRTSPTLPVPQVAAGDQEVGVCRRIRYEPGPASLRRVWADHEWSSASQRCPSHRTMRWHLGLSASLSRSAYSDRIHRRADAAQRMHTRAAGRAWRRSSPISVPHASHCP